MSALTDAAIVEIRDELLPSQGEAFDCIAFARAVEQRLLNTPELHEFARAAVLEALHQRQRWGSEHDAGKTSEDWLWLVGYLCTKATQAQRYGDTAKALHHTITAAAALANWHAALIGANTAMRPGIAPPEGS